MGKRNPCSLLVQVKTGPTTTEINMEAFPRTKNRSGAVAQRRSACIAITWVQFPASPNKSTVVHNVFVNGVSSLSSPRSRLEKRNVIETSVSRFRLKRMSGDVLLGPLGALAPYLCDRDGR